ncbi:hypothetical protein K6119_13210 [Paracrocinitomix mangrovi]|uniref:hypothetical protein n=1 Tax=Paracrocinitomix mangrovi TaxID=2862509 RepID=UPI001C8D63C6|nr:hypothetical protein [Paracrocinitomix mangrovi]UKN00689.1 hypothetical protein K6119_13210 [Paracrocinitomix mangrovi]
MSEKVVGLIRTIGVIILFVIGVVLIVGAMQTEIDPETNLPVNDPVAVSNSANYSVILVYMGLGAIAIFSIWSIIQNPKRFIRPAIGIAIFGVLALISYGIASDEMIPALLKTEESAANATPEALKWGGAGIKGTFILVGIAIVLILIGTVMNMKKYFSN